MIRPVVVVVAAMLAAACGGVPVVVAHRPPTGKDVIDAVLASAHVGLSVSPTCTHDMGKNLTSRT